MNTDETDLSDWISVKEAARLVPSPRGGHTHLATIYRWIHAGKLECRCRGRWRFVRRSEILALLAPCPRPAPEPRTTDQARRRAAQDRFNEEVLCRFQKGGPSCRTDE